MEDLSAVMMQGLVTAFATPVLVVSARTAADALCLSFNSSIKGTLLERKSQAYSIPAIGRRAAAMCSETSYV